MKATKNDKKQADWIIKQMQEMSGQTFRNEVGQLIQERAEFLAAHNGTVAQRQLTIISALETTIRMEHDGNWIGLGSLAQDIIRKQYGKVASFGDKAYPLSEKQLAVIGGEFLNALGRY